MSTLSKRICIEPDTKSALAQQVYEACHLTGDFVLRSGRKTHDYFDKYQIAANPTILNAVTKAMAELIPLDTEVLAGLEMGAVPIATMISHHSGLPAAFVRKKAKEHGTARLAEGVEITGRKVLVIEDIATSGGQIVISTENMRALGANITHALVVIDRKEGAAEALRTSGIKLISFFSREDFSQFEK